MSHINIEIKARCPSPRKIRRILKSRDARFEGEDYQTDTYFNVSSGRMKLREGNIENYLIHYERNDEQGPKQSNVTLLKTKKNSSLKEILAKSIGVLVVVQKKRGIYWIENVKFHIDDVIGLGSFVEIEAVDSKGKIGKRALEEQCSHYISLLGIRQEDMISESYSDMILKKEE